MAFEWDEAKARERVAAYTAALEACGEIPYAFRCVREAREKLEAHCWHDLRYAFAEIDRLRAENERLENAAVELSQIALAPVKLAAAEKML